MVTILINYIERLIKNDVFRSKRSSSQLRSSSVLTERGGGIAFLVLYSK